MYDVVAMGEVLIDFTCKDTDQEGYPTLQAHPGGAPANFLAALSRYGCRTAFLGKVGKDAFGKLLIDTLKKEGIDTRGVVEDEELFTTLAFVTLDENGEREFSFARKPGADTGLKIEEVDLSLLDKTKIFHFGSLSLTHEPARETTRALVSYAREKGIRISYDPNLRKPLWKDMEEAREQILWGLKQADVVKISDEEVEFLFHCDARKGAEIILQEYEVSLVFVTCGSEGCYYSNGKAAGQIPGLQDISVKDTTGAGDIFGGSALSRLLQIGKEPKKLTKEELEELVYFSCVAAGLSTTKSGGISSIFNKEDVEAYGRYLKEIKEKDKDRYEK